MRGMFVGFSASMMTHIPCSALSWPVYEYSRKLLYRHVYWPWLERTRGARSGETHHEGSHFVNLAAGTVAGVCTGVLLTPFDVVRVRQQAQGHHVDVSGSYDGGRARTEAYSSVWRSMRTIVLHHGTAGLWRGVVPRVISVAPSAALSYVCYEYIKNLARRESPHDR